MKRIHLALVLLIPLLFTACDGDGPADPDLPQGVIYGTVTDAAGRPVEGATVALVFGIDDIGLPGWDASAKRIKTTLEFAVPDTARIRLEILDHARDAVRTLVDGMLNAGRHTVIWDGTDEDGALVPVGVYFAVLSHWPDPEADPEMSERKLFVYDYEPASLVDRPLAVTDAAGRYAIDLDLIPVGERITITDESGQESGVEPISHRVRFLALLQDGDTLRQGRREVTLADTETARRVDLTLP